MRQRFSTVDTRTDYLAFESNYSKRGIAMKRIVIADEIFDMFPQFYRAIVVVRDINNQKSNKRLRRLLKGEIDRQMTIDESQDPRILAWDEAHRRFGSDPEQYPPSITSLLRNMRPNQALPFINSAVALFNYISLKYVLPCGGDDFSVVEGNLVLGISDGTELFVPLGSDIKETPVPGEVIYYDDATKNVMCRRWNWRNGEITKIEVDSKNIVLNVDCLPPITFETGDEARDELADLLKQHCDAHIETSFLNASTRELDLS
jgi:DNA/RNA-binding domain of Phe-tRNA-synthetase-like protein